MSVNVNEFRLTNTWIIIRRFNQGEKRPVSYKVEKKYFKDDCGYAGLELLANDIFAATTYGHWVETVAPYIISVRFKMEEIEKEMYSQK